MNTMTLTELQEKLATYYDEVSILELLNINSFELVARFQDKIEERFDKLAEEFEEDTDGDREV